MQVGNLGPIGQTWFAACFGAHYKHRTKFLQMRVFRFLKVERKCVRNILWHMKITYGSNVRVYKQSFLGAQPCTFVHTLSIALSTHFCDLSCHSGIFEKFQERPRMTHKAQNISLSVPSQKFADFW